MHNYPLRLLKVTGCPGKKRTNMTPCYIMHNQKTILIVEDDALVSAAEQHILEEYGYAVITTISGKAAIEIVDATPDIALILMDIDLGKGIDGTEVANHILQKHDLPIVFLSSHTEPEIVEKMEKTTSYGYIVKGSSMTVLYASIKMAFKLFEANKALKEKESLLLSIAENYPNSYVFIIEKDFTVGFISGQELKKNGGNPQKYIGTPAEHFFGGMDDTLKDYYLRTFGGEECAFELFADSEYRHYRTVPLFSADGTINRILAVVENITERKKVENTLHDNWETLCTILNTVPQSVFWKDTAGNYLGCNRVFAATAGLDDPKKIIGLTDYDLPWPKEDADAYRADDAQVIGSNCPKVHIIEPLQDVNGVHFWIDTSKVPLCNIDGVPFGVLGVYEDISERKKAEELLRTSEANLKAAQSQARLGSWEYDMRTQQYFWSEELFRIFGCDPLSGVPSPDDFFDRLYPDDREQAVCHFRQSLSQQVPYRAEWRILQPDKNIRWIEAQGRPIFDGSEHVVKFAGTAQDITERKQIEAQVRSSMQLLQTIIDHSQYLIYAKDFDGRFVLASQSLAEFFGQQSAEQLIGKTSHDFLPKNIADKQRDNDIRVAEKKSLLKVEEYAKALDGFHTFITTKFPLYNDDGEMYAVCGTSVDITEQKRTEEELKKIRMLLEATEQLSSTGGWEWDIELQKMTWTEGAYSIYGFSPDDFSPGAPHLFEKSINCYDAENREKIIFLFEQCVTQGKSYTLESRFTSETGRRLWVLTKAHAVIENGLIIKVLGSIMDITDQKVAEEEIRRQLAEKEMLLREVHHRIKNNIASIEGLLLLQSESVNSPEAVSILVDAGSRVHSIRVLYDNLLMVDNYKEISAKKYIENLIDTIVQLFPNHDNITVHKEIDDFVLDSKRMFLLGIIVNELITNVVKYAFVEKESGEIIISLTQNKNTVQLTIQDNGTGLPENFNINESSGFGLMLVRMLTEQLGGSYTAKTTDGIQSILTFMY